MFRKTHFGKMRSRRRLVYTVTSSPVTGISRLSLDSPYHMYVSQYDTPRPLSDVTPRRLSFDEEDSRDSGFESGDSDNESFQTFTRYDNHSSWDVKRVLFPKKRRCDETGNSQASKRSRTDYPHETVTLEPMQ